MSQQHDLDALAAFVEDRLDDAERARLTTHLAECAECRGALAAMTRARAAGALREGERTKPAVRPDTRRVQFGLALAASAVLATFAWLRVTTPPEPADGEEVTVRRGAERIVKGKTFRLEDSVWIDRASDESRDLPVVTVAGAEQRALLLTKMPELAEYADLGARVVVVADGKVYRFEP